MSLIVRGAVFTDGKVVQTGVRVEEGVIVAVSDGDLGEADRVVELGPRETLAPAGVETLCALRDWNERERDTVETVTRAALAAGVTVTCDQANTSPRLDNPDLVRERSAFVAERSYTDFGISAHPPRDPGRVGEYPDAGAYGLVLFPWDLRPWNFPRDTDDSAAQFQRYAELGLPGLIFVDEMALRETALRDESERYALEALLRRLHPDWRVRLLVLQPASVEAILAARERLPNVLITTAVHNLLTSREAAYERIGSAAFHVPALRPAAEAEQMRAYLEAGLIDLVVSQHAPHRLVDKYSADPIPGEFTPKAGYSAMDYTYPLLASRLGLSVACRAYAEAPARHLGLKKGKIAKGYEADFAVFEEEEGLQEHAIHTGGYHVPVWKVDPMKFQSMGKVTPFVGERLKYRVARTFLRGEAVFEAETGTFTRRAVRHIR